MLCLNTALIPIKQLTTMKHLKFWLVGAAAMCCCLAGAQNPKMPPTFHAILFADT